MILVILGISIAAMATGFIVTEKGKFSLLNLSCTLISVGSVVLVVSMIAALALAVEYSALGTIDEKIEMYQEENARIEAELDKLTEEYQGYANGTTVYYGMESHILVQTQMNTIIENNDKIKELKEQKINGSAVRWWLYFGG